MVVAVGGSEKMCDGVGESGSQRKHQEQTTQKRKEGDNEQ